MAVRPLSLPSQSSSDRSTKRPAIRRVVPFSSGASLCESDIPQLPPAARGTDAVGVQVRRAFADRDPCRLPQVEAHRSPITSLRATSSRTLCWWQGRSSLAERKNWASASEMPKLWSEPWPKGSRAAHPTPAPGVMDCVSFSHQGSRPVTRAKDMSTTNSRSTPVRWACSTSDLMRLSPAA